EPLPGGADVGLGPARLRRDLGRRRRAAEPREQPVGRVAQRQVTLVHGSVLQSLTCDCLVTYSGHVTDDDHVFKALADPTRRHLLDRLFERDGRTLTELESEL